jgi:fructose-specific phosphotransferase system IIC component
MQYLRHPLLRRAGFVGAVLLLPLIGTLLQAGFTWSLSDFAIAAVILWLLASISSWLRSTIPTARGRWFALLGVVLVGALCWVELAVGVFGSPLAGS